MNPRRVRQLGSIAGAALIAATVCVPIVAAATPTDLFISEYLEGSSANKALEIYNGTDSTIDLTSGAYALDFYTNGSPSVSASVNLLGSVPTGLVWTIANPSADPAILAWANATNAAVNFNGNDTIVLRHGATVIDVFGQIGVDPGLLGWGVDPTNSVDNDLVRKAPVTAGDTNGLDVFNPADEWDGFATDTFTNLGSHTIDTSGGGGGGGSDNGAVGASVTVPSSAACIEISTSAVDFGTLPLGAEDQPGTPDVTVTNCSGLGSDIYAHGTDAADGAGAAWTLADTSATCADTLGVDNYRLGLEQSGSETSLGITNKLLESLASGAVGTHTARIWTACPGSSGSGTTMSMQVVFLATTGA